MQSTWVPQFTPNLQKFTPLFEQFTKIYVIYSVNCIWHPAPAPSLPGLCRSYACTNRRNERESRGSSRVDSHRLVHGLQVPPFPRFPLMTTHLHTALTLHTQPSCLSVPVGRHSGHCLSVTAPSAHHTTPHHTTPHHTTPHHTTPHHTTPHHTIWHQGQHQTQPSSATATKTRTAPARVH